MHLINPLATGIAGCENGSVDIYRRGTVTRATYYTDFEGTAAVTPVASVALDSRGGLVAYVNELVQCICKDSTGATIRSFVAGVKAQAVEVISTSFTGTDYVGGATGVSKPTTLSTILNLWTTNAGAPDWKVLVGGVATTLQTALASIGTLFFSVKDPQYGAVGDGSTDDTAAIQEALDAAELANGGTVFFPAGRYKVTSALTVAAGVNLLGAGSGASWINGSMASGSLIVYDGSDTGLGGELVGPQTAVALRITNAGGTSDPMVSVPNPTLLRMEQCSLFYAAAESVSIDGAGTRVWIADCTHFFISNAQLVVSASTADSRAYVSGVVTLGNTGTSWSSPVGSAWMDVVGGSCVGCDIDLADLTGAAGALWRFVGAATGQEYGAMVVGNMVRAPASSGGSFVDFDMTGTAENNGLYVAGNRYFGEVVRETFLGSAAASSYYAFHDTVRERGRYYVASDAAGVTVNPNDYSTIEVTRTTTGNQTVTVAAPNAPGLFWTLVYDNNQGSGGGTITMTTTKGLATFTVNATSVSYYTFVSVHRGTTSHWALVGSAVNVTRT
jgi:hypothetical protein